MPFNPQKNRILILDDNVRAGALLGARLLERGYTCRVSRRQPHANWGALPTPFHLCILEVPTEEAHQDRPAPFAHLGVPDGLPLILSSPAPLDTHPYTRSHQVRHVLTKPFLPDDLARAIESSLCDPAADPSRSSPEEGSPSAPPPLVRALDTRIVRATVQGPQGLSRARIRAMSPAGQFELDCLDPLKTGTRIRVTLPVASRVYELRGRVTAHQPEGFGFQTEDQPHAQACLAQFYDEALDPKNTRAGTVAIRAELLEPAARPTKSTESLEGLWVEARQHMHNEDTQQNFIQACIQAKQPEFAAACYRGFKEQHPESVEAKRYLEQVGTILGFYALRRATEAEESGMGMPRSIKIALALLLTAAAILVFLAMVR